MIDYLSNHLPIILLIVVLINQLLADIPAIKANTIFKLFRDLIKGEVMRSKPNLDQILAEKKE